MSNDSNLDKLADEILDMIDLVALSPYEVSLRKERQQIAGEEYEISIGRGRTPNGIVWQASVRPPRESMVCVGACAPDPLAALGELHKTLKADLARRADAMAPFLKTEAACVECGKPIHLHTAARGCP
jgi:hypothetical protein